MHDEGFSFLTLEDDSSLGLTLDPICAAGQSAKVGEWFMTLAVHLRSSLTIESGRQPGRQNQLFAVFRGLDLAFRPGAEPRVQ